MATTAIKIDDSLPPGAATATGGENAGRAVPAYPSDEEILGMGPIEIGARTEHQASNASSAADAGKKKPSDNTESTEGTAGTEERGKTKNEEAREKAEANESTKREERTARAGVPAEFEAIFAAAGEAGPKLREIYQREAEYRELFPSVDEARSAAEAQRELARVDELFESGDPAAHVELMAGLAQRDPAAFRALAATFGERLAEFDPEAHRVISAELARAALQSARVPEQLELLARAAEKGDAGAVKFLAGELAGRVEALRKAGARGGWPEGLRTNRRLEAGVTQGGGTTPGPASGEAARFVQGVNAEVERNVEQAVSGRVAELLPDAPDATRRKISADIYRELDAALKKDAALLQQVSANFGAAHHAREFGEQQRAALAALVLSKAKAVLPGVAKRVVSEWTSAVISASQARRSKHVAAAARADVGVGGAPRPVSTQPPRIDYRKMSDEEILNADL